MREATPVTLPFFYEVSHSNDINLWIVGQVKYFDLSTNGFLQLYYIASFG